MGKESIDIHEMKPHISQLGSHSNKHTAMLKKEKKADWRNVNPDHIFDNLKKFIVNRVSRIMVL